MKREYIAIPIEGTLVKLEEVPESTFASVANFRNGDCDLPNRTCFYRAS